PIRLHADGSLDTSFTSAYRSLAFPVSSPSDIEIDSTGRIFLAGVLRTNSASPALAFSCLSPSGAIDTAYPLTIIGDGYVLLRTGNHLYLAGESLSVNGGPVRHLVRIDLTNDSIDES